MRSSRRNNASTQRDGFEEFVDNSPSPKLYHSKTFLKLRSFLNSFPISLNFLPIRRPRSNSTNNLAQRHQRSKGFKWKQTLFNLLLCFILGTFIGCTPFFSINIPELKKENKSEEILDINSQIRTETKLLESQTVESQNPEFQLPKPVLPQDNDSRKLLIIVTITQVRPLQAYYLNKLAHTLSVVQKPVLWIVVDRVYQSMETARILMATGLMYRHFACMMNVTSLRKMINCQRNIAIYHIKKHHINGIVYFADDDGIYSAELFEEMRKIKRFGTWPVAQYQDTNKRLLLEGPLCKKNKVIGWHSNINSKAIRRFHISLYGIAFNSTIIWDSKKFRRHPKSIIFHSTGKGSSQDSKFIELLVEDERQMEGLGDNCTKIMVWKLGLEAPHLEYPSGWSFQNNLEAIVPVL